MDVLSSSEAFTQRMRQLTIEEQEFKTKKAKLELETAQLMHETIKKAAEGFDLGHSLGIKPRGAIS